MASGKRVTASPRAVANRRSVEPAGAGTESDDLLHMDDRHDVVRPTESPGPSRHPDPETVPDAQRSRGVESEDRVRHGARRDRVDDVSAEHTPKIDLDSTNTRGSRRAIAVLVVLLIIALPVVTNFFGSGEIVEVETARAQPAAITPSILASGLMTYGTQVKLLSELLARVDRVNVDEGNRVQQGDVMVLLDTASYNYDVEQLRAARSQAELARERDEIELEQLRATLRAREKLLDGGYLNREEFDSLVSRTRVAEVRLRTSAQALAQSTAELAQQEQLLKKHQIASPIDGIVTDISIEAGEIAVPSATNIPGAVLMTISSTESAYAELAVDEADIGRVEVGQAVRVTPIAFPDHHISGEVESIGLTAKESEWRSRSFAVRVRLEDSDKYFFQGMSCRAEILVDGNDTNELTVPLEAVISRESSATDAEAAIFVLERGTAVRRPVDLGLADDANVEIVSGVDAEDAVIVGPPGTLRRLRGGERARSVSQPPTHNSTIASRPDQP